MSDEVPQAGIVTQLEPGLRRIIAPNPSPMTFWGTNTFLLGQQEIAVIDPGPDSADHLDAILAATKGSKITYIIVTHSHLDHSPLAASLSRETGAPVYAFGDRKAGRSVVMEALANDGLAGGGEGVDPHFRPDIRIGDGDILQSSDWKLTCHHTPGHMGNHLALSWGDAVFTGDLIMGWASTMVSPPDGDLADFLASCSKLRALNAARFYPAHGDVIEAPTERIDWLVSHRMERSDQILNELAQRPSTIKNMTKRIYHDAPKGLLGAAARNVFAHLIELQGRGLVHAEPALNPDAVYSLCDGQ